jgi:hypothetical protein
MNYTLDSIVNFVFYKDNAPVLSPTNLVLPFITLYLHGFSNSYSSILKYEFVHPHVSINERSIGVFGGGGKTF